MQVRVRFMLDVLMAIKNNNMRKIPSYDPTHIDHLRKVIKGLLKGMNIFLMRNTGGVEKAGVYIL